MLFVVLGGYHSIREVILGLLANAHKLSHLGLCYLAKRSTFSEANKRRSCGVFEDIYMTVYKRHPSSLADSRPSDPDLKRLFILDSSTISLFKGILKGVGRNPKNGKKKGGIIAHTIIKASENVPCLARYSEAARHDHMFLEEVMSLPAKGYVDYARYEAFSEKSIWYVTRLKGNAQYEAREEFDIPGDAGSGVLKDEEAVLFRGENKAQGHRARRIAYWDSENERLFEFITNNFYMAAEKIAPIYKKRWQIGLIFKQLKQNFPLKYPLGGNENAIEIQIWPAMLANILVTLAKSKIKRCWAFSNMVSIIGQQLMGYINIYAFLENPEKGWPLIIKDGNHKYQNSIFPNV